MCGGCKRVRMGACVCVCLSVRVPVFACGFVLVQHTSTFLHTPRKGDANNGVEWITASFIAH